MSSFLPAHEDLPHLSTGAASLDSRSSLDAPARRAATPTPLPSEAQPSRCAPPQSSPGERPLTVGELTTRLRTLLQANFHTLYVEGEISGCRPAASGHVYFTLKDSSAAISCLMWRNDAARLRKPLRDGDKVEVRGTIDVFAQRGTYQIVVSSVSPAGVGQLFLAFEELKERLKNEGLFDAARKQSLPRFARVIGVITSPTGAAVRDVLKVLSRRAPHVPVLIAGVRVQGAGAAEEIAAAIDQLNQLPLNGSPAPAARKGKDALSNASTRRRVPALAQPAGHLTRPDIIILARGGGSIEDLWAFNEEVVARAVADSKIPLICGVGHETDTTIADFAADCRAATPTAAAEIVTTPARDELLRELVSMGTRMEGGVRRRLGFLRDAPHLRARLDATLPPRLQRLRSALESFRKSSAVQRPRQKLNEMRQRLDEVHARITREFGTQRSALAQRQARLAGQLTVLDPKAVLSRGYSITLDAATGRALRSVTEPAAHQLGHPLKIILSDGAFAATASDGAHTSRSAKLPQKRPRPTTRRQASPKSGEVGALEFFGLTETAEE